MQLIIHIYNFVLAFNHLSHFVKVSAIETEAVETSGFIKVHVHTFNRRWAKMAVVVG